MPASIHMSKKELEDLIQVGKVYKETHFLPRKTAQILITERLPL